MAFPLEALCYSALPAHTTDQLRGSERPQPENKQKSKHHNFQKKEKLEIICDFSTFFNTVRFDPLEEWLFRIRVGNLLLFRLKLRKFPKTFDSLNF